MILDAGFLISVDRGERVAQEFLTAAARYQIPLSTTHPVVAQVWRNGARQARLSRLLQTIPVHPLDDGPDLGLLLARSSTSDVVDAHLVSVALRLGEPVLTGDVDDITALTQAMPVPHVEVQAW